MENDFHPGSLEDSSKVMLSPKVNKPFYLPLIFNNSNVTQLNCQKHLEMILNSRLTFDPASTRHCHNVRFLVVF